MSKVLTRAVALVLVLAMMLAGCSSEKSLLEELNEDKEVTLRILTNESKQMFREYYGGLFGFRYSNIDIELIPFDEYDVSGPDGIATLEANISRVRPDVVFLSPDAYKQLAARGKLYNLEPIMQQEKFDVDMFLPGLIDWLRKKGGGSLYGMEPYFYPSALFYNADLFRQYGVELPHDGMTWDDVLHVAARFRNNGSSNDEVNGFYTWSVKSTLFDVSNNLGLELVDSTGTHMLIESESWKRVFSQVIEAVQNRDIGTYFSLPDNEKIKEDGSNLFLSGRAAMTLRMSSLVSDLNGDATPGGNKNAFDWGVVTAPIDPRRPGETPYISHDANGIVAIPTEAEHKREAWEFIKFLNGPEQVQANARNPSSLMLTRGMAKSAKDRDKLEPFYKLRISQDRDSRPYHANVPVSFREAFDELLDQVLARMIRKEWIVEQGIAELNAKGDEMLKQAQASQNGGGKH